MTDTPKLYRKTIKKAKKFFQGDAALKVRVDSLMEFMEDTACAGKIQFLKDNYSFILNLLNDYFHHKCKKLKGIDCMR